MFLIKKKHFIQDNNKSKPKTKKTSICRASATNKLIQHFNQYEGLMVVC